MRSHRIVPNILTWWRFALHGIQENDRQWDAIIRPRNGWFDINFRELFHYRDLIFLLVKRDITLLYKQTILGPAWILIQALLHTLVFTVVFGGIASCLRTACRSFFTWRAASSGPLFSGTLRQCSPRS